MNIDLTKNEYRLLLDLVFMASWMVDSHHPEGRDGVEEYDMLLQKLYSFAREMGCEELVPTRHYEETTRAFQLIEEYNDDTFWDALISRLAERDVYEKLEKGRRDTMGIEEYWERSEPIEEAYYQEFLRHALDRLRLVDN